jgi:hypothetical protein
VIPHFLWRLGRIWLLALCDVALALVLAYELAAPSSVSPRPAPRAAAAVAEPAPPSFTMPPIRQYREVLARPLFNRSRRPNLAAEDAARPVTSLELVGIVIAPDNRLALLQYGNPPKLVRAGIGQTIAGWTIAEIRPEDVLVRQGDTVARVKPRDVPPTGAEPVNAVGASSPAGLPPAGSSPAGSPPAAWPPAASASEGPPSAWGSLRRYLDQTHSDDR